MSETPDDIRSAAKAVRAKLCLEGVCEIDRGCACLNDLAEALMAERLAQKERCWPKMDTTSPAALEGARALRDTGMETNQIARAIIVYSRMSAAIRATPEE